MTDPNIIYEVAGSGLPYREEASTREQVWDTVFERKSALTLKESLEREDPKVVSYNIAEGDQKRRGKGCRRMGGNI